MFLLFLCLSLHNRKLGEEQCVYPSILQTWLKSFFKWKEIAIKGRVIVTWYLQRRGCYSASCSEAIQRIDWKEITIKRRVSVHIYRSGEPQLGWLLPKLSSNRTRHGNEGDQFICQTLEIDLRPFHKFLLITPNTLNLKPQELQKLDNFGIDTSDINWYWTLSGLKIGICTLSFVYSFIHRERAAQ